MKKRNNVAMLVWNEFLNDARVLKEAETLQRQGYKINIFALHTPGKTLKNEKYPSGINVFRILRNPLWNIRVKIKKNIQASSKNNSVYTNKDSNKNNSKTNRHNISFIRTVIKAIFRIWAHLKFIYYVTKLKPDIIHAHDLNMLPTAYITNLITRSILIYDTHEVSLDREGYKNIKFFVYYVEKILLPRVSTVITTTRLRAKFFSRFYKIKMPTVLYNQPRFVELKKQNVIREKLDLKLNWPIVLYQGGIQQNRGLETLVSVIPEIKNAYFVFIGNGRLKPHLQNMVENLCISERVFFIDTVPLVELLNFTASASIGIQPIENTCFNHFSTDSNKLFEYIIAGLPIIASNMPEIKKIVSKYNVGEIFQNGNKTELSTKINKFIDHPDLVEKYRQNSIAARRHLCWETQESKLIDIYKKISTY